MRTSLSFLAAGTAVALGAFASAQIQRLDLPTMLAKSDNALFAEIVDKHVFRVDHPVDGPELYFTTLTLAGRSLVDGKALTVDVTYPGGFVSEKEGVHNSEAPSADDVKLGNHVVAFYFWNERMGGGVSGNMLQAMHGGLFRTVSSPGAKGGAVVLGRGNGYAVDHNVALADLEASIRSLAGK
jgi:hypothetical protein